MKRILLCLCLVFVTAGLAACNTETTSEDTCGETAATVDAPTETPTETLTEAPTEVVTVPSTEAPTEEVTEPETEGETVPDTGYPVDKMTIGGVDIHSFTLVVQNEGLECVRMAADELILYMEKATGYVIPEKASDYEIVIGVTDRDTDAVRKARGQVKDDGYVLLMDGNRLYITGESDAGTMYGVYSFLEDYLGVRFLATDCTVIRDNPDKPIVEISSDVYTLHNPTFIFRDIYWYDMMHDQTLSHHLKDNTPLNDAPEINGGYNFAFQQAHTMLALIGQSHEVDKQLCMTDEKVYQAVLTGVRRWLSKNPDAEFISVSQSDGSGGNCQCENCKAIDDREGTPMGSLLTFVNRIAADIKDEYPNVYVETLAYSYTEQPPKTIKPADNVVIRLCMWPCAACSFADGTCETTTYYRELLQAWAKIAPNLFVWTYTTDYSFFLAPYTNLDQLWENMKFFKENNVMGLFVQGNQVCLSGEFGELRAYLLSKLAWDPDMTREEYYTHMDEFLEGYYGPGWEHIRAYIDETCNRANESYHEEYATKLTKALRLLPPPLNASGKRVDEKYGMQLMAYWEAAMAETTDEVYFAHLEKSSIQVHYYCGYLGGSKERQTQRELVEELAAKYGIRSWAEVEEFPVIW